MKTTRKAKRLARRLFRRCRIDGGLDEQHARQIVRQIGNSGRRNRLGILWQFHRLVKLYSAGHTATVQSAVPLPAELRSRVEAALARDYGPGLSISFAAAPELIGGMRVRVGSDVYDDSVQGRLAALERRL